MIGNTREYCRSVLLQCSPDTLATQSEVRLHRLRHCLPTQLPSLQTPATSLAVPKQLTFLTNWLQIWGSYNPQVQHFIRTHRTPESAILMNCSFIIAEKDPNQDQPKEETCRARSGRAREQLLVLSRELGPSPPTCRCVTVCGIRALLTRDAQLQFEYPEFFFEVTVCKHDSLAMKLNSISSFPPWSSKP